MSCFYNAQKSYKIEAKARKELSYTSNFLVNILYDYKYVNSIKTISRTTFVVTSSTAAVTVVLGPVAVFCMVYHYTKRVTLTKLLGNVGPAIYVVLLNKYFVILPILIQ